MMKQLWLLLFTLLCHPLLAADIFYTEQFPPYNYYDRAGEFTGLSYDIITALEESTGVKPRLTVTDWKNAYNHTMKNPQAALFSVARFAEREKLFKWVGPLVEFDLVLYAAADNIHAPADLEAAKKMKIGIYSKDQEDLLRKMGFSEFVMADDDAKNIVRLTLGEIDLWLANPLAAPQQCREIGLTPMEIKKVLPVTKNQLYLAFNSKTPDTEIVSWQTALDKLKASGELDKIRSKYEKGEFPMPGTAKSKGAKVFAQNSKELEDIVGSNTNLNLSEYDFPEYQITEKVATEALELYQKDPVKALEEFRKHGKFFNIKQGRYVSITDSNGKCVFNAAFPFREGEKFSPAGIKDQHLASKGSFWSYKTRLHPSTGEYVPQYFYGIPFADKDGKTDTLYLSIAGAELPFDRHFAITMAEKTAALIQQLGIEKAAEIVNDPSGNNPFRVLSGAGVFIDNELGTILANSLSPQITGRNLYNLRDKDGNFPIRMTIRKAKAGGGWLSGFFPSETDNNAIYKLVYVRTAKDGDNLYVVGSTIVPLELTRKKFAEAVYQFDRLATVWVSSVKGKFELAQKIKDAGLSYQSSLIIPDNTADNISKWENFGNLAGARAFDFCYASVFNKKEDALKFALEADRLWRNELMAEELFNSLEGFSFAATARSAVNKPELLHDNFQKMNSKLLDECLRHEENMQLAVSVIYGGFIEGLYITSSLLKTAEASQYQPLLKDYQNTAEIINRIATLSKPLQLPVLDNVNKNIDPLLKLISKNNLNETDIDTIQKMSEKLRKEMLEDK